MIGLKHERLLRVPERSINAKTQNQSLTKGFCGSESGHIGEDYVRPMVFI